MTGQRKTAKNAVLEESNGLFIFPILMKELANCLSFLTSMTEWGHLLAAKASSCRYIRKTALM